MKFVLNYVENHVYGTGRTNRKRVFDNFETAKKIAEGLHSATITVRGINVEQEPLPSENKETWQDRRWQEIKKEIIGKSLSEGIRTIRENDSWYKYMFFNICNIFENGKYVFPLAVNINTAEAIAFVINSCKNQVITGEWKIMEVNEEILYCAEKCARRGCDLSDCVEEIAKVANKDACNTRLEKEFVSEIKYGLKNIRSFNDMVAFVINLRYSEKALKYVFSENYTYFEVFFRQEDGYESYKLSNDDNSIFSNSCTLCKSLDFDFIEINTVSLRMTIYNDNGVGRVEITRDVD